MKDFVVGDDGTIVKAPILYTEKLSIYFVKRACNPNNIFKNNIINPGMYIS